MADAPKIAFAPFAAPTKGVLVVFMNGELRLGGPTLRAYAFERYKTKRKEGEEKRAKQRLTLGVADVPASRKAWVRREAVHGGVALARDLVNEPPNVLSPEEFARRAASLKKLGV